MLISKVLINDSLNGTRTFSFKNSTLISSDGRNQRGKTSLIRYVLWAIGFDVDLTEDFIDHEAYTTTVIEIYDDDDILILKRAGRSVSFLREKNMNQEVSLEDLVDQKLTFLGFADVLSDDVIGKVFELNNFFVMKNLLGLFYFDQDEGWKTFNDGPAVSKFRRRRGIRYVLREILIGLSGEQEKYIELQKKQRQLKTVRDELQNFEAAISPFENIAVSSGESEQIKNQILNELDRRKSRLMVIERNIEQLEDILRDYDLLKKLLFKFSIGVRDKSGDIVELTHDNVVYTKKHEDVLRAELKTFRKLRDDLKKTIQQLSPFSDDESQIFEGISVVVNSLGRAGLSMDAVRNEILDKKKAIKASEADVKDLYVSTDSTEKIFRLIQVFASQLKLTLKRFTKDDMLATTLPKSGAGRQKQIVAFRLAALKLVQDELNVKLPIILDSPQNSELSDETLDQIIEFIQDNFEDNQLIIATNAKSNEISKFVNKGSQIILSDGIFNTLS